MNDLAKRRFNELQADGLLPSPRGVAMSILEATQQQNASISDIVPLIQMDPAMAGRVLRYANSAHAGHQRHIASLKQAITFLGLFRVRQIALSFALIEQYRVGKCPAFDYAGYWSSSLATGIAAQQLAPHASSPPDESFTCGLLSGIGRLALATAFPDDYGEMVANGLSNQQLIEAENNRFGIDHAQLSAEMLLAWGLPDIFANAVRHHEDPTNAPCVPGSRAFALTSSLHFAMRIGQLLNLDDPQRWDRAPSLFNAAALTGIDKDDVSALVEKVVNQWQEWAHELNLPTRAYPDLQALLAAPPLATGDNEPTALMVLPLRIILLVRNAERRQQFAKAIELLGLTSEYVADWEALGELLREYPLDVAIVEVEGASAGVLQELKTLRRIAGNGFYCLVVIPQNAENEVAKLMLAGASDYLLQDALPAALLARLTNAQRQISLQNTVKAERELAVSSSGEWARANRRLIHDALTDVLTQLPNRRYGMDRFAQEWSVATSNALPISCMMLDIDHFKKVNDQFGHDIGDMVLRQVAAVIESNCRRSDIVFRYGGEEFCAICPSTNLNDAALLGDRIVRAVRAASFGPTDAAFRVTISIGLAVRGESIHSVEELLAQADAALYAAKAGGRDRVVSA